MYCGNTDCQTFSCHRNKAIFELTSDFHPDFLPEYSLYDYGIVELYDLDPNLKVCNLCRYYRPRDILFDDLFDIRIDKRPIFCCLYKKLGTDKYRDPSDARTCTAFRKIDGKTMAIPNTLFIFPRQKVNTSSRQPAKIKRIQFITFFYLQRSWISGSLYFTFVKKGFYIW